jgi:esterase/lipase
MNNNLCKYFKSNLNNLNFKDCYENLINLSKQLKWYNYRNYFIEKFKNNYKKDLINFNNLNNDINKNKELFEKLKNNLDMMKRIVTVQNLYADKMIINKLNYSEHKI